MQFLTGAQFVTLNLQTAAYFNGAKKQDALMSAAGGAFKRAVTKQIPIDQKQGMELAPAKTVAAKL